ncbi:MAG: YceI family protein, partial [Ilumatobacteraceae bacterium]
MSKKVKIIIGSIVGLAVLAFAAVFIYVKVIKDDAPKAFDESSLDSVLGATTTTSPGDPTTVPGATTASSTAASTATTAAASASGATTTDGTWNVASDSVLGYRVKETLAGLDTEGAGRTSSITGTMTIAGTAVSAVDLTVDMTTFKSDDSRRDGQFNGNIMDVAKYPTATFALTSPVDLGGIPSDGSSVTVKAIGDLTMHGATQSVTFDLTAKETSGRIGVVGSTVITFADYGIDNPSNGFATTGDSGTLELQL